MRKGALGTLICGVAIALLFSLAVVLSACSDSGGKTSDVKTYTDKTYGFSFDYPADWKVEEGDQAEVTAGAAAAASVGAFDPKGANTGSSYVDLVEVSVYKLNTTVDESMMPAVKQEIESTFANLESQGGDWKAIEPLSDVSLAGLSGWKTSYTFSMKETPARCTFYMLFGGATEYQLLVQAAESSWQANRANFDAFLASFKPGS
jgi:hypothetical protein